MTIHVKFRCNHVYSFQEIAFIHFPIGFNVKKKKKKTVDVAILYLQLALKTQN